MNLKKQISTAFKYTVRNKELSMASILVLTIAFILINFFSLTSVLTHKFVQYVRKQGVISVLFDKENYENIQKLAEELNQRDDVSKTQIQTYDELSKKLIQNNLGEEGSDLITQQDTNYLVTLRIFPSNPGNVDASKKIIDFIEGKKSQDNLHIARVIFYEGIIQKVETITKAIQIVVIIITIFMIIIAIVLIYITIGFTINKLQHEIEIMNLIGATKGTIETPFALQGALYGFISTLLAYLVTGGILYAFYYIVIRYQSSLLILKSIKNSLDINYSNGILIQIIAVSLSIEILIGVLIGYLCAKIAIHAQLKKLMNAKLFKTKTK